MQPVRALGRRLVPLLDPVRPRLSAPNPPLPATNRVIAGQIDPSPLRIEPSHGKSSWRRPKSSPNHHSSLKNPRCEAHRRRRPHRDGWQVQEDNCTGASGAARPAVNGSVRPDAGRPFHVWTWRLVTTTPTSVHGGLPPHRAGSLSPGYISQAWPICQIKALGGHRMSELEVQLSLRPQQEVLRTTTCGHGMYSAGSNLGWLIV